MSPQKLTVRQLVQKGNSELELEDFQGARETFETLLADHPSFPDIRNKLGLCKAMLGDTEEALAEFEKAVELAPDYAEAQFNRGLMLNDLGRHEEAEEAFAAASRLDVRDSAAFPSEVGHKLAVKHAELGDLYIAAQRPELAADQYRQALDIRARFVDIRVKLASALLDMEKNQEAKAELEEAVKSNPGFAEAYLYLGVVLNRLGETEEAIQAWEDCLEKNPREERARSYLAGAQIDS